MLRLPERVAALFRRGSKGTGVGLLLRQPQPRLHEMDREEHFAGAMEQSAAIGGPRECQVIIQGGEDKPGGGITWYDLGTFYSGAWCRDLPVPDMADIAAVVRAEGLRYARLGVRTTI